MVAAATAVLTLLTTVGVFELQQLREGDHGTGETPIVRLEDHSTSIINDWGDSSD